MRKTGPVTQKEVPVKSGEQLISATDPKSRITHCNDTFVRISGYSADELIGEAHNILRHPDMPQAAFKMLWDRVQSGRPWMGLVKNRCKNGDHYWVDAYVMPVWEGDQIVGYESVRVKTNPVMQARAERLYGRLNAGRKPFTVADRLRAAKPFIASGVLIGALALLLINLGSLAQAGLVTQALTAIGTAIGGGVLPAGVLRRRAAFARDIINDPVAQYVYTGDIGVLGQFRLAMLAQQHHSQTVLGRMANLSASLSEATGHTSQRIHQVAERVANQRSDTDTVAAAVHEMSATIREVAENTRATATQTANVSQQANDGSTILEEAVTKINRLSEEVGKATDVVSRLSTDSGDIKSAVDSIGAIAEQTNLLALNAAIEAARAGEQGRGFAVVADEVRSLAQRTQESTVSISDLLNHLASATEDAVVAIQRSRDEAVGGVDAIDRANEQMSAILAAVADIERSSENISQAASEQETAANEISDSTSRIAGSAEETNEDMKEGARLVDGIAEKAREQASLVDRFSR